MGDPIQILVDGIHIERNMKGVGRYVLNTLTHLAKLDESLHFSVLVFRGTPKAILPGLPNLQFIEVGCWTHVWHWLWTLPLWARRIQPRIVWIPYEVPFSVIQQPYVIVCHDVPRKIREAQRELEPSSVTMKERIRDWIDDHFMGNTLRRAEIVFSNSEYVANWLKTEMKIIPSKIRYAPCAPGADFQEMRQRVVVGKVLQRMGTSEGYILVFYTGDARENLGVIGDAYQSIIAADFPEDLVIAGVRDNDRPKVECLLNHFSWRERAHIVPFLGVDRIWELAEIYTAASVYLDLSLHEGFGMQVIEAMACGTPVVCSNRGALPEVARDSAILVDPKKTDEIVSALKSTLRCDAVRNDLIKRGYERSATFSWKKTADLIHEGLLNVVRESEKANSRI